MICKCGKPGLVSRERLNNGAWSCLDCAKADARVDARPGFGRAYWDRVTDYFIRKFYD